MQIELYFGFPVSSDVIIFRFTVVYTNMIAHFSYLPCINSILGSQKEVIPRGVKFCSTVTKFCTITYYANGKVFRWPKPPSMQFMGLSDIFIFGEILNRVSINRQLYSDNNILTISVQEAKLSLG